MIQGFTSANESNKNFAAWIVFVRDTRLWSFNLKKEEGFGAAWRREKREKKKRDARPKKEKKRKINKIIIIIIKY